MSKPKWEDAPEWAQWLAMDANGVWFWYSDKPAVDGDCWRSNGKYSCACDGDEWESEIEERPCQK